MASRDLLETRKLLRKGQLVRTGTDTPIAIRIRNKASKAVTSVTVTTATNIVLIDSDGTTTSTFATDTTIGAVADRINASANWEAKVLDCLRALASASTIVTGVVAAGNDENGVVVYDATVDTSAALQIGAALSPFRNFDAPKGHRVNLKKISYSVDMGTAAANSAQLWVRRGAIEKQLFGALSVDTTATTVLDYTAGDYSFNAADDAELIFLVKDAATLADAAGNYVQIEGSIE